MSQVTEISTLNESSNSLLEEQSQDMLEIPVSDTMETSTSNQPPGPLLEEKSQEILNPSEVLCESMEPSWGVAAQQRLLDSELQGKMYKKSIPLEPFVESPNSSWGEIAQK